VPSEVVTEALEPEGLTGWASMEEESVRWESTWWEWALRTLEVLEKRELEMWEPGRLVAREGEGQWPGWKPLLARMGRWILGCSCRSCGRPNKRRRRSRRRRRWGEGVSWTWSCAR